MIDTTTLPGMSQTVGPEGYQVDLGTFINLLTDWHKSKVEFLSHLKDAPEGITMSIDSHDGNPPVDVELSGELYKGFKIAMGLAISELGPFPISRGVLTEIVNPVNETPQEVTDVSGT